MVSLTYSAIARGRNSNVPINGDFDVAAGPAIISRPLRALALMEASMAGVPTGPSD